MFMAVINFMFYFHMTYILVLLWISWNCIRLIDHHNQSEIYVL